MSEQRQNADTSVPYWEARPDEDGHKYDDDGNERGGWVITQEHIDKAHPATMALVRKHFHGEIDVEMLTTLADMGWGAGYWFTHLPEVITALAEVGYEIVPRGQSGRCIDPENASGEHAWRDMGNGWRECTWGDCMAKDRPHSGSEGTESHG